MKVLALVILAVASVSSKGSGPYLPSGWRPEGPAFYLPSEVQKPADNPLKDTILNESEASGSDALREYGPPNYVEVSQDLTRQALPETVTEQAFVVIEAKFTEINGDVREQEGEVRAIEEVKEITEAEDAVEVTTATEQKTTEAVTEAIADKTTDNTATIETIEDKSAEAEAIEDKTTEVEAIEDKTTKPEAIEDQTTEAILQGRAIGIQAIEETIEIQDATTEKVEATTAEVVEVKAVAEAVVDSKVESTQVEQVSQEQEDSKIQEVSQAEVKTVEGVQNVVEALESLEKEIKAQQIQINEEAADVKSVQVLGSEEQAPEGFLEYGPPGFREYGPPQADELLRSGAVVQEPSDEEKVENNETRRRRFSPKFRPFKKH